MVKCPKNDRKVKIKNRKKPAILKIPGNFFFNFWNFFRDRSKSRSREKPVENGTKVSSKTTKEPKKKDIPKDKKENVWNFN